MGKSLPLLNNSRAQAFRRCPRLHYFAYELGYRRIEKSKELETGSIWHASLEAWWDALMHQQHDDALNRMMTALPDMPDYERARAEAVLSGYHCRWIDETIEVLGVEVWFSGPLVDPITGERHASFDVSGTLDAICRVPSGNVLVVEHKTSSQDFSVGAYYWRKLTLNSQVSMYLSAGPALGLELSGCLYDVIGKAPNLDPRLATPEADRKYTKGGDLYARQRDIDEAPEDFKQRVIDAISEDPTKFYGRGEVVRLGSELEDSLLDVWQVADLITEARERSRWPRNTDSCFAFNRECEFYAVCTGAEDLENSTLFEKQEDAQHTQENQHDNATQ